MSTQTYADAIEAQRIALAANLTTQGEASVGTEPLSDLVAKVLDIVPLSSVPDNGANNVEVTDVDGTLIPEGYYDGTGSAVLSATEQAKVIASNIKDGVTILGVTGNVTGSSVLTGDITASDVLDGKIGYADDPETQVVGNIPLKTGDNACSSSSVDGTTLKLVAPTGFYGGTDTVTITDAGFTAANIADGVNIFGIDGTHAGATSTIDIGLIGKYTFNGDVNDSSGLGFNGTATGLTYAADSPGGANQCAVFDGSTSYVAINALAALFCGYNNWSFVVWIKTTQTWGTVSYPTIIQCMPLTNSAWNYRSINIYTWDSGSGVAHIEVDRRNPTNGMGTNIVDQQYNDGAWHMLVFTYDGTTLSCCGDDGTVYTETTTNVNCNQGYYLHIGKTVTATYEWFAGKMANMRFYSRELTTTEITELYNSGAGVA